MSPSLPEPTLGEVMRRLDDVSRQMVELAREMKDDRALNAATFVRKDVYLAEREADQTAVRDIATDLASAKEALGREIRDVRRDMEDTDAKRVANVKWFIGVVLIPIALALLALVVSLRGGTPA